MADKMPSGVDGDHRFVDWVGLCEMRCWCWAAGWFLVGFGVVDDANMLRNSVVVFNS